MEITYLGHGCLYIVTQGIRIMVDPFITPNPLASAINLLDYPVDYILLTHGHVDHTADMGNVLKNNPSVQLVAIYELATYFENQGFSAHAMNIGGKYTFDFGTLKMVQAVHSSMLHDGSYGGSAAGVVLWNDEATIYIAGDTALTMDMQLIPLTCPDLDLAILPIGDNFTMGYEDALMAADFVKCSKVIGMHYDTFAPIKIDLEAAHAYWKARNKVLLTPAIGESIAL